MKIYVATFFMFLIVVGMVTINHLLGSILQIDKQPKELFALWFLYVAISSALTGWFGAKYMFTQFLDRK